MSKDLKQDKINSKWMKDRKLRFQNTVNSLECHKTLYDKNYKNCNYTRHDVRGKRKIVKLDEIKYKIVQRF